MSREIKYRAWDSHQNKMLSWQEIGDLNEAGHLSLWNLLIGAINHIKPFEWTGLNDKNGTEIYKEDIVQYKNDRNKLYQVGEIFWSGNYLQWFVKSYHSGKNNSNKFGSFYSVWLYCIPDIEVVGNIFEHPELLNQ